jgi:predicted permease
VNGAAMTIVGVTPEGFTGTTISVFPDVFVPIVRAQEVYGGTRMQNRRNYWAYLFGRLAPGVSIEQARATLSVSYNAILNEIEVPLQEGISAETLERFEARTLVLEPGPRGQSEIPGEARPLLTLLISGAGLVLLIACANIANLLLVRASSRSAEFAIRLSVGANRRQLIAQLLTESALLAALGCILAFPVARWIIDIFIMLLPQEATNLFAFALDVRSAAFSAALAAGSGFLCGIFPALHCTRRDLVPALKGQAGQPSGGQTTSRLRSVLVGAQIAVSMALLILAGLFMKSLSNLEKIDLGLNPENVVTFRVSPGRNGYTPERSNPLYEQLEDELRALPGVAAATASNVSILNGDHWNGNVSVEGVEAGPDTDVNSRFNQIAPGFLRAMGMPLIAGREFTRSDAEGASKVAIVNEAFAAKFGLGRDAVGKRMKNGTGGELDMEIVGLVRNARYNEVKGAMPPVFFVPYRQTSGVASMAFYVRTSGDLSALFNPISGVVARLDRNLPVEAMRSLDEQIAGRLTVERLIARLAPAFGALATLLAAIGLYGVIAYAVAQRSREIGIRMALGATPGRIRNLVLRYVTVLVAAGAVGGVFAALAGGRAAESMLYGLTPHDPLVLVIAITILAAVAFGASLIPAWRASRIDPMRALRYD